jgi:hypothetical protein
MTESNNPPSVVLVHGGSIDGSDWQSVYRLLRNDGYAVGVVQNPTLSLVVTSRRRDSSSMNRMDPLSAWDTRTGGR